MKEYANFFENIKEADMRLRGTVVLYDEEPYYVLCVCDHKPDGIFRVYLDPIGVEGGITIARVPGVPYEGYPNPTGVASIGQLMDDWLEANPNEGIIRKMANSPKFNRFRPFELGMCNSDGGVMYIERQPSRNVQQGLTNNMTYQTPVSLSSKIRGFGQSVDITGIPFKNMIKNIYPTSEDCLKNLQDPSITNEAAAFHRKFALVRGPVDMIFLAYKADIVGVLPRGDFSLVKLGKNFVHTKEVIADLGIFSDITF